LRFVNQHGSFLTSGNGPDLLKLDLKKNFQHQLRLLVEPGSGQTANCFANFDMLFFIVAIVIVAGDAVLISELRTNYQHTPPLLAWFVAFIVGEDF